MFCPNCGKELPDGSRFCGFCGADIAKELQGNNVTNDAANDMANGVVGGEANDVTENVVNDATESINNAAPSGMINEGTSSTEAGSFDQNLGGYDPFGNSQSPEPSNAQTFGNQNTDQLGGQPDNNQFAGGQFDNNQFANNQYGGQFNNSQFAGSQYGGQFDNNQFAGGQYGDQQFGAQNPNMQYGAYGPMNQQPQPAKKSKKGLIAAIISIVLVIAIGGVAIWKFWPSGEDKDNDKDKDKKKDKVTTEASTDDEKDSGASNSASEATTEPKDEVSGEEALDLACENLSKVKDMTTEFTYVMECSVEAPDENISGEFIENGKFEIVSDFDVNTDDADANMLEEAKGTVSWDILGTEYEQEVSVFRGNFSGEFISGLEYGTGERYVAAESTVVSDIIGFYDYDQYNAKLQDKTETIDGVECYVYVSEDTYDKGGICGVFTPVTGIYFGDTDLCTVTIYVSKEDAQLVKVETVFTDLQDGPLQDDFNTLTGAKDIEFKTDKLEFELTFKEFDKGIDIDPDFEDLEDKSDNMYSSFMMYLNCMILEGDFDFTDTDDDVTKDDDTDYVTDTYGALTYEVPKDWEGEDMDVSDMSGHVYYPDENAEALLLVMYEEYDTSSFTDSQKKELIDTVTVALAENYGVSSDDIKKGTVNGGYAENVRGAMDGTDYEVDIMVFETGGSGVGIVIFATDDIANSEYLAQYYHLLESLEF